MYRLNLDEISGTVEFFVDSIAWDNIPTLWLSLKKLKFRAIDFFLIEWILTMFVKNFNLRISGFIFDQFFLDGDVAIYKGSIAILGLLEPRINVVLERKPDVEEVRNVIMNANNEIPDFQDFIKAFNDVYVNETILRLIENGFNVLDPSAMQ
jgi:hypothetical protein